MKVYLFGNQDVSYDNKTFDVAEKLKNEFKNIEFVTVKPNEDLPFIGEKKTVLMDTIMGIDRVEVFTEKDLEKVASSLHSSAHDFDLGFQLKYLKKLGKLDEVVIIGLPMTGEIDYFFIHSILRKLVAQDMQGS
jgi:Ni,Fe-hydrogenase maturation factor